MITFLQYLDNGRGYIKSLSSTEHHTFFITYGMRNFYKTAMVTSSWLWELMRNRICVVKRKWGCGGGEEQWAGENLRVDIKINVYVLLGNSFVTV